MRFLCQAYPVNNCHMVKYWVLKISPTKGISPLFRLSPLTPFVIETHFIRKFVPSSSPHLINGLYSNLRASPDP